MSTIDRMPTELLLTNWRGGQADAERLAADVLGTDGYEDIDPQAPLGGPDGAKDILCTKKGKPCLGAVYFPIGQNSYTAIEKKFRNDITNAIQRKVNFQRFIFITNQRLTPTERKKLAAIAQGKNKVAEILHVERLRNLLDSASGYGIRAQYLNVSMTTAEQVSFFNDTTLKNYKLLAEQMTKLQQHVTGIDKMQGRQHRDIAAATMRLTAVVEALSPRKPIKAKSLVRAKKKAAPALGLVTPDLLCFANRLACGEGDVYSGRLREEEIWVGKVGSNIQSANFVPPGPELVPQLVEDMCNHWNDNFAKVNKGGVDGKLQAIARFLHQFSFIHPFLDGNGRTLRALARQLAVDLLKVDKPYPLGEDRKEQVAAFMLSDTGDFQLLVKLLCKHLLPT